MNIRYVVDLTEAERQRLEELQEATLIALACTKPPQGRSRWTMQLLADHLVASTDIESVSAETVRRRLAENELKPWQKRMWSIPEFDADYVANMEDVLDTYAKPPDPGPAHPRHHRARGRGRRLGTRAQRSGSDDRVDVRPGHCAPEADPRLRDGHRARAHRAVCHGSRVVAFARSRQPRASRASSRGERERERERERDPVRIPVVDY